jgi:hypothetical protein
MNNSAINLDGSLIASGKPISKPRLVIVINGGCVVNVYASEEQSVEIIDCDNLCDELQNDVAEQEFIKISTTGLKEIY